MTATRFILLGLTLLGLFSQISYAQDEVQLIKANSKQVNIKQDGALQINAWTIVPEANPDVFTTSAKSVVFYTDVDSIAFEVEKGKQYDFVILLNDKDSAYTRIVWEPSKLDILKRAHEYNYFDARPFPKFEYQSADHPDLVKLRKAFKLDSIAGKGSELAKIFNLLHWVHNLVPHDGSSSNPSPRNAINLIEVCKAENRGVNCRMLATILNECYLACGIKSRFITCMPRETNFDECHVINMVFSTELDKWIWIDPTFAAYVMDENGIMLGILEVRERLINRQTLVINADANWNRTSLQKKEHYLDYYMAKNLYRMECPLNSQFDAESHEKGKELSYVELLPLDGIEQEPQKEEFYNDQREIRYFNYKTNNPDLFWARPE